MGFPLEIMDHLGRKIVLAAAPQRIVSLCPSQTETLVAMGLGRRLVGRTRFCIHPKQELQAVRNVGGTKSVNLDRIRALRPDLIIGEKEENTAATVAALEREWPVFVTDVRDIASAARMIADLGTLTGLAESASAIGAAVADAVAGIQPLPAPLTCVYMIWKNPWMAAGSDTFIHSILERCGWINVAATLPGRYPVLDLDFLAQNKPRAILLSTEPFPFKDSHILEIQAVVPNAQVQIVEGEMFSWYGVRMIQMQNYLNGLLHNASQSLSL
ncbi:MAG: hypothetical protein RLZZ165_1412 [Bacteroidota bacterium]